MPHSRPPSLLTKWLRPGLAWLGLVLSACTSTPHAPSDAQLVWPQTWKHAPTPAPAAGAQVQGPQAWWLALNDPVLTDWMEIALLRNRDLVRSALRLQQASLQARRTELDRWPRLNANLGTSVQQMLGGQGGATTTQVNGVSVPVETSMGNASTTANGGLSAAFELDLWGRVAKGLAVSEKDRAMAQADLATARWLLTTQVAEQYWSVAAIDAKQPYLAQAVEDAQANLEGVRLKRSVGKARVGDEYKAQDLLKEAMQRQSAMQIQREQAVQTLALLMDEAPQSFHLSQAHLPAQDPAEPDSWPLASVLDRLPSVQRSRLALDQALLKRDIAQTNRYPQLSLSASLNSSGNALINVLTHPMGALGLSLTLPMLDWTRLGLERDGTELSLRIAVMDFREALFKALGEVDTQYNNRRQWQADAELLRLKTAHAQHALQVAQLRHAQGVDAVQSVREAQSVVRELQLSALDTRLKAWLNQVAIFKAWGGPLGGPATQAMPP